MIVATGAFRGIRRSHAEDRIVLLTMPAYRWLGEDCGLFDEVWTTAKPARLRPWEEMRLARRIRRGGFDRIYDLQWSSLSNRLFRAVKSGGAEWAGVAPGCSHFYTGRKAAKHIAERHAEMLALAGVEALPPCDFAFLRAEIGQPLPPRYALLVPGSSARQSHKRWPIESYIGLCQALVARQLAPVLVCGREEAELGPAIARGCPGAIHFDTPLPVVAELARGATVAVGNDTGPLHLIAAVGCPTVALFGPQGTPTKSRPLGRSRVLQADSLAALPVSAVLRALDEQVGAGAGTALGA